jgi:hypothetical protein
MNHPNSKLAIIVTALHFYIDLTSVVEKDSLSNLRSMRNCAEQFLGKDGNINLCKEKKKLNVAAILEVQFGKDGRSGEPKKIKKTHCSLLLCTVFLEEMLVVCEV